MSLKNNFYLLNGKVQHYQWGGDQYIPMLLQQENSNHQPYAEYWLGAHHQAPAVIKDGKQSTLNEWIAAHPEHLGNTVQQHFGRLPYLLKVLDVNDMLSIQVHPTKAAAAAAFKAENEAGISLDAPKRNYKDDNHKPELMVALGEFWLLHGFREPQSMLQILAEIPQLHFLIPVFEKGGYRALYETVMTMPQAEVNERLKPLLQNILPMYKDDELEQGFPDFWAARAALTFNNGANIDRGIFSVYLLNLVQLQPGEAVFQDAGILHAYLYGQNIEIMANSDNVLRGGLTPKHIDVPELLKHVRFEAVIPQIIKPSRINGIEELYESAARDFKLSVLKINAGAMYVPEVNTAEIFLIMNGAVEVSTDNKTIKAGRGESFIAFAGSTPIIKALAEQAVIYRASVAFPH